MPMMQKIASICLLALAGCYAHGHVVVVRPPDVYVAEHEQPPVVVVEQTAPAPRVETVPPAPGPNYVWCAGYWHWTGDSWEWVSGEWLIVKAGYRWMGPRYEPAGRRVRYWRAHFHASGRASIGSPSSEGANPQPAPPEPDRPSKRVGQTESVPPGRAAGETPGRSGEEPHDQVPPGQAEPKPGSAGAGQGQQDTKPEHEDQGLHKGQDKVREHEDQGLHKGQDKVREHQDRGLHKGQSKVREKGRGDDDSGAGAGEVAGQAQDKPKAEGKAKARAKDKNASEAKGKPSENEGKAEGKDKGEDEDKGVEPAKPPKAVKKK